MRFISPPLIEASLSCLPTGSSGAEERHRSRLRHEDPTQSWHAGERTGEEQNTRTNVHRNRERVWRCFWILKPVWTCSLLVRLDISVLSGTSWWRLTVCGWSKCSTASRIRWTSTSSWSFFPEVRPEAWEAFRPLEGRPIREKSLEVTAAKTRCLRQRLK